MQTITIASQKGGSGKSTLALHLGTLAQADGTPVLIASDPQGSRSFWHERRADPTPLLVRVTAPRIVEVTDVARREGITWCLIDTAPHDSASMANAMRVADLILIPARPSALDLHAIEPTLRMAVTLKKRSLVILSQTQPRHAFGEPSSVREARDVIKAMGGRVAEAVISSRMVAAQSVIAGLSVGELEPNGPSAKEFQALWNEIKQELMTNG